MLRPVGSGAGADEAACVFEERDPAHFVSLTRTKDLAYLLINSHAKLTSEVGWLGRSSRP